MLKLVTITDLQHLIKKIGIEEFFSGICASLHKEFSRWEAFNKTPRHVLHYPHGVIELMPIADDEFYSVKYVNGHPYNPRENKLTVVAMGLLADVVTGYPLLISEMTLLTAIRTAGISAIAAQYLARKNSQTLALIGTGSQAEFQAIAHYVALGIKKIRYFDIDANAMDKFSQNLSRFSLELTRCKNIQDTIAEADIITTATADKKRATILQNDMIKDGVHINGIGGDCAGKTELDIEILHRSRIVVEYLPQTQVEGEIQHIDPEEVYAELWELIKGEKPGRVSDLEVTLFDSVGFALEDFAILKYVYQKSLELNIGSFIPMLPSIEDPKNLFSLLE